MKNLLQRKDVTVLLWVAVSNALIAVLSYVTSNPDLYDPIWVGVANIIMVSYVKRNK